MDRNLALVLGGGGAAGNAWEIGVVAGLAEAGFDLTREADLMIGTSAGATSAAQLRSGVPVSDLLASALAPPPSQASSPTPAAGETRPPALPLPEIVARMRAISEAAASADDIARGMGEFGLAADAVIGAGAALRRATVAARFTGDDWPDRPTMITAVDAHTGEFTVFDGTDDTGLVDAVTASCALPGLVPTHVIGGRHYIDGGVRSSENADLAAGYDVVVILAPLSGRPEDADPGRGFEGLRRSRAWGTELSGQVDALREAGSRVELVVPDASARAAMGANMMNPAARAPAARAGYDQGRREATRFRPACP
ncbi:MAG: patatin-like phospholipase family protein [Gordonia sp. (in: high G+C Gram-positive bacteria)]|uniref:patatin-like phospholipase family protein n=1 Tax=Gordonia sp. (in: high G+C Gram-positive bacteria) TaxID=84139 RepID=UPI003C73AD69